MSHLLSKSKYIRGLQCDRALWLDAFNPRLARYTAEQMRRFDRGRDFEYAFKSTFPDGIDVSAELKRNVDAYPARTAQLLDSTDQSPFISHLSSLTLFEAGFQYDDVLVLADVVRKNADGTIDVFEVKSGTELSDTYRRDAAVQYYVISHCRKVHGFSIVYNGLDGDNGSNGFSVVDLTEELATQLGVVEKNIAAMKEVLRHGEPDTPTGAHCLSPYACPYQHYCALGVRQMSLF